MTSLPNVLVMIEGVYLQKLLINVDAVCMLVCSCSFDVFLLYFMYTKFINYLSSYMIFVAGKETCYQLKNRKLMGDLCVTLYVDEIIFSRGCYMYLTFIEHNVKT